MNNTIEFTARAVERASDWANPILVKEIRQALKSRQFVITFLLLLAGSWVISTFGMLSAGDAIEYGSTGRQFFFAFYFVLAIAIFIVVPFGAYRSLLTERDENTYELLSITTLSPRQIVWGKLLSALVQLFIYYSAIAPFIAFTSLLEGFDLAQVAFVLVASMLVSLLLSMAALMSSTMARRKQWQALTSLSVFGGLVFLFMVVFIAEGIRTLAVPIPFDDPEFWWALGIYVVVGVSYFVLMQQITTAQLTFESDNRSTGIRVTCSVQFWLFLLTWILYWSWTFGAGGSGWGEELMVLSTLAAIHWSAVGLFAVTEPDSLSSRIRRGLPRALPRRAIAVPFLPGSSRGYVFVLLHLTALWLFVAGNLALAAPAGGSSSVVTQLFTERNVPLLYVTALCCYIIIYLGIAAVMGRWARLISSEIQPAHIRVLSFLVFLAGCIAPYIPAATGLVRTYGYNYFTLWYVSNPFTSLWEVQRASGDSAGIVLVLLILAVVAIAFNLRAMKAGIGDVLAAKRPPKRIEPLELTEFILEEPNAATPSQQHV